ncbi:hypothetical protein N8083_02210, partial [Candidatus Pacebacteria bacterium]|nr:hypothetical protein [Candidatus Paceibacterota bacterium]
MKPRDWMILFFTFAVGLLSGMYVYVTSFKPIYEEKNGVDTIPTTLVLSIIGVTYGGMTPDNYNHPTFKVNVDGSYSYFAGGSTKSEKTTGTLPKSLFNTVASIIETSDLEALSTLVPNKECALYADGIETEYNIEVEGVEYELDSCATDFDNDSELGNALSEIWKYVDEPNTYKFSISNSPSTDTGFKGLRGYFDEGFK